MSCIVKCRHPNGTVYVYEQLGNVWNSAKKMSVPQRRLIGKIDPNSGEVVPTGRRGRPRKNAGQTLAQAASPAPIPEMDGIKDEVSRVKESIADQKERYGALLSQVRNDLAEMQTLKIELKKTEASLDALILAIQPLV